MNISTGVELLGFGFLDFAAWHINKLTGLTFSGLLLVFIGYVFEDEKALLALKSVVFNAKKVVKRKKKAEL